jgi:TonB family protein
MERVRARCGNWTRVQQHDGSTTDQPLSKQNTSEVDSFRVDPLLRAGDANKPAESTTPKNTNDALPRASENGYGTPVCLYCPQPGFSDEAIKAKHFDGVVVLEALITTEGRATNVHVIKAVGLGLDIKALEIIPTWRFKPATGPDGRAASVVSRLECKFHLGLTGNEKPK